MLPHLNPTIPSTYRDPKAIATIYLHLALLASVLAKHAQYSLIVFNGIVDLHLGLRGYK